MNLQVEKKLLDGIGMQVDLAMSGADALALSLRVRYDVIFMDHLMPEMDGPETLRRLRRSYQAQKVRDLSALLEIRDERAVALQRLGRKVQVTENRLQFAPHLRVSSEQFQMVAFAGVGDAPAREERSPQKRRPTAVVLQHGEIDV